MTDKTEAMHYAYHPIHGTLCVHTTEYSRLLLQGWYDNPMHFNYTAPEPAKEAVEPVPVQSVPITPIVLSDTPPVGKPIQYRRGRPKKEVPVIVEEPAPKELTDDEKAAMFITGTKGIEL